MRLLVDYRPGVDAGAGGVGRVARALVQAYAQAFDDELILATTGWKKGSEDDARRVHLRLPNKLWSLGAMTHAVSLDREIERRVGRVDAVLLPNLAFVGRLRRPYILLLHDLSFLIEPRWFTPKMRLWHKAVRAKELIRGAAHLLSVSETTKRDAVRLLDIAPEKITVIQLGSTLNPSAHASSFVLPASCSRYVLALGEGDPRKNAATAIEAVRLLRQNSAYSDISAVVVGNKCHPELVEESSDHSWLHILSRPSDDELQSLYARAAAFLYPSWYEGYGLPLHEAASYGTPCVSSTAGALPETAPPGTFFADPAKPHHWAEALRLALQSPRPQPKTESRSWDDAALILHQTLHSL